MEWDNTIVIGETWGPGKAHSLTPPNGGNLEFRLVKRFVKGANGESHLASYAVDFSDGTAPDAWKGAIFFPMGKEGVKGIAGLPNWDKSNPKVCTDYQMAIEDTEKNNLGNPSTKRLGSIIPYVDASGNLGYNYVRLFYVQDARQSPTKHLFVIKTATAWLQEGAVRALQDGSGHGPPE